MNFCQFECKNSLKKLYLLKYRCLFCAKKRPSTSVLCEKNQFKFCKVSTKTEGEVVVELNKR